MLKIRYLAFIPARKDSRFIPNLNTQLISGKPLVQYVIDTTKNVEDIDKIYISTDYAKIMKIAKDNQIDIPFLRPKNLCYPETTFLEILTDFLESIVEYGWEIENIIIIPANYPLINSKSITDAIKIKEEKGHDSLVFVRKIKGNKVIEGSDGLEIKFKDEILVDAGIYITKPKFIQNGSILGGNVCKYQISNYEAINIRSYQDMRLANIYLSKVKVILHFIATSKRGFGHYYRILSLARRLFDNNVILVCSMYDEKLVEKIEDIGFKYYLTDDPVKIIDKENPDIVINDILNTEIEFMEKIKSNNRIIVNFEDLGEGSQLADLTFNALYEDLSISPNHYGGGKYAIMRDEFLFKPKKAINSEVKTVLVSFGGSDPANLSEKIVKHICPKFPEILFVLIIGPGYVHDFNKITKLTEDLKNTKILRDVEFMSDLLIEADLSLLSGGRTVFESAACGTPAIVICQNNKELHHNHVKLRDGVINLGLYNEVDTISRLENSLETLVSDVNYRIELSNRISNVVDGLGIFRIMGLIEYEARQKNIDLTF